MTTLQQLIIAQSQAEWANPNSLTSKNSRSLPSNAQAEGALIVFADMGGVCTIYPSGKFQGFDHSQNEITLTTRWITTALGQLQQSYPHIANKLSKA